MPNSYWVIRDRLAAGEYPGSRSPVEAAGRLSTFLEAGIDYFIDLTESEEGLEPYGEAAEEEARRLGLNVEWKRHPIVDGSVPRSPAQMAMVLDAIDDALDRGMTVYVHCWGGVGRTGTVVGCWLVRHGHSGDEALRQVAEWWKGVEKGRRLPNSPETWEQRQYVRNWIEPTR